VVAPSGAELQQFDGGCGVRPAKNGGRSPASRTWSSRTTSFTSKSTAVPIRKQKWYQRHQRWWVAGGSVPVAPSDPNCQCTWAHSSNVYFDNYIPEMNRPAEFKEILPPVLDFRFQVARKRPISKTVPPQGEGSDSEPSACLVGMKPRYGHVREGGVLPRRFVSIRTRPNTKNGFTESRLRDVEFVRFHGGLR